MTSPPRHHIEGSAVTRVMDLLIVRRLWHIRRDNPFARHAIRAAVRRLRG